MLIPAGAHVSIIFEGPGQLLVAFAATVEDFYRSNLERREVYADAPQGVCQLIGQCVIPFHISKGQVFHLAPGRRRNLPGDPQVIVSELQVSQ